MGHQVRDPANIFTWNKLKAFLQQWYKRRKTDVDCYVGEKFTDPVEHEDPCPCTNEDYEW
jgi:hypothetical protein